MRFRLRPVSESTVEADDEGTPMPVTVDVVDCCSEDDDVAVVDDCDDEVIVDVLDGDCAVLVALVIEEFSVRARPITRATQSSATNTTERFWFKA